MQEALAQPPLSVPLLSLRERVEFFIGCVAWLATVVYFWNWWLLPVHVVGTACFIIVTLVLAWITFEPLYFLLMFSGARKPAGRLGLPPGSRVAMVVTKAPSEPFAIVAETLLAMLAQDYPHDTWLADEDPTPETIAWCAAHGVRISTRRGRSDYHRASWPRRTRCKEGNLAFFYDHYGYELYDFVCQLDADHVPEPSYLREMLRPFANPAIGYVSAPSICDRNAGESWSARGRLHAEASMHGALQAGYNGGWAPICIGSHYAVRTTALKQIGGLGPELAEDHSTTLMMNAAGWRGVHALDAIAHGDGPRNFADMITQEFQWSRSLVSVLLQYTPRHLRTLPLKLKAQFLFCQVWYPLFSSFMALMFLLPIAALAAGVNFAHVTYPGFFLHFAPISFVLIFMGYRWRATGSFRPFNGKVLSWEKMLFGFARWPWVFAGTLTAIRDWITGRPVEFRVTPKGSDPAGPLPIRVFMPYVILSLTSALPVLLFQHVGTANGFYIFTMINATIYAVLVLVIVLKHMSENGITLARRSAPAFAHALLAVLLLIPISAGAMMRGPYGLDALARGAGPLSLTRLDYQVAGAAQGGTDVRVVSFEVKWQSGGTN
jgi:cellulose synthase/poly-beta-1,6-N-acetylglucosamine synthase-like glycosyltransferase